ncbi:sigma-70 family RNA polymerase sigma factor [Maribellus sp. YY47]|uniref:RNA polymerase sigma factor n=1 Tax=Maribellus sp. YY47 TaxID=2929486 RepID=UPI00200132D7|nr:sigma-70 family RNA polymerase sigma factor [Maribellus sp. YY47]
MQQSTKKEFSERISEHQGIIHKVTMIYADSPADREDLFQEICLQLWRSYARFRGEAKFSTWMYRVALNTAISNVRKNKNKPGHEFLNENVQLSDEGQSDLDQVRLLFRAVAALNRIDKAIILLWLDEKSYDEIATIMGTSKSNVSVKLVRIKRRLEALIKEAEKHE